MTPPLAASLFLIGPTQLSEAHIAAAVARTSRHYDAIPYISYPATSLQPSRLAALATLFGVPTPSVRTARTLEIGCASGGHLIPLAASFPEAQFVGIDVSQVQIDAGRSRVQRLGLNNIDLLCQSVTDLTRADGRFDYIICHGVYSWVPPTIRDAILRLCRQLLTPDGVAVISYNVLPGWRMFQVVRDCMMLHAGSETEITQRSARVHELFRLFQTLTPEKLTYGRIWRHEAQRMATRPDAYLAHELFEENSSPCTFSEFLAAAAEHQLTYLGETELHIMIPENIGAEAAQRIRELSNDEVKATEQYIDSITGRTFRQSLLVPVERARSIDRSMESARAAQCYWICGRGLQAAPTQLVDEFTFVDSAGTVMTAHDRAVAQALRALIERFPEVSRIDEICPTDAPEDGYQKTLTALMKMLSLGMLNLTTEPVGCAHRLAERPKAWFVCANDAASGEPATATLRHENFRLEPVARALLPLLDGTRDVGALTDNLFHLIHSGAMTVRDENGVSISEPARLRVVIGQSIGKCLSVLKNAAILVQPP
jgi:SAM-dependent methyltransferase/methyltransferase-like protein